MQAGAGWEHIDNTQQPKNMPWKPEFSKSSVSWSVAAVTNDNIQLPEREFQFTFSRDLRPTGDGPGGPYIGKWSIQAAAETDYMVIPAYTNQGVGTEVTFSAIDEQSNAVVSVWSISPTNGVSPYPLPNGSSVTFSSTNPGPYTVTGQSTGTSKSADAMVDVLSVDIVKPQGSLDANPNPVASWLTATERFDFQGIKAGVPGAYVLDIEGEIEPVPPASYKWTLDASAGTLANDTTATPTHTAPAVEGEGTLTLKAMVGTTDTGCQDERKVKIYKDCLERDKANFGTGISCANPWSFTRFNVTINMNSTWNCHGSSVHLYDGSGNGAASGIGFASSWAVVKTVTVTHVDGGGGSHPSLGTLNRGDLVVYYTSGGDLMHSQTCTGNGTETYGANNEPLSYPGAPSVNESYKWATSTAGDWANDLWQPDFPPPYNTMPNIMPVTIKVLRRKP